MKWIPSFIAAVAAVTATATAASAIDFNIKGQWNMGSGGLPPAAVQGKFAAWRICKKEGVPCK